MNRLLLAAVALSCVSVSAQTINPNQIKPSATDGQVITTSGGKTIWGAGGGGGGNINPAPQFRLFMQPNAGTQAVAGPATTGTNAVAPMMQGTINADLYGGISAAFASSDCASGCTVIVPPNSTDSTNPSIPPASAQALVDQRAARLLRLSRNPSSAICDSSVSAAVQSAECLNSYLNNNIFRGYGHNTVMTVVGPGFNLGFGPNTPQQGASVSTMFEGSYYAGTRGIAQLWGATENAHSIGDKAGGYFYLNTDGGQTDGSGEGNVGGSFLVQETSSYYHGTITSGGTTGSTSLVTHSTSGQNVFTDGGYLIDITKGGTVTGTIASTATTMGWGVWNMTGASMPVSTAWGTFASDTNASANGQYQIAVPQTLNVNLGTSPASPGDFAVGNTVCLVNGFIEQVPITAAPASSGGVQSITFSTRYAWKAGTLIMQGGMCGQYLTNTANASWRTAIAAIGSFSSSQVVPAACNHGTCTISGGGPAVVGGVGDSITQFPGAEIIGTNGGQTNQVQLGLNTVAWANSDVIEGPHPPAVNINVLKAFGVQHTKSNTSGSTLFSEGWTGASLTGSAGLNNSLINLDAGYSGSIPFFWRVQTQSGAHIGRAFTIDIPTDIALDFSGISSSLAQSMAVFTGRQTNNLFSKIQYNPDGSYSFIKDTSALGIINAANVPTLGTLGQIPMVETVSGNLVYSPVTVSGDATLDVTGALALKTVNTVPGACGDATHVCQVTTNGKGLVTNQAAVAITGGGSFITSLTTTGTSGPSTVTSGVLNIPQYAGGGYTPPTGTGFAHITSGTQDSAARAVNLASADVTGLLPLTNLASIASTNLSDSASLARLASPALTGTPTAPTATTGTNTTQIATTAFVLANAGSGNTTSASLTTNALPKATGAHAIGDSAISDDGTNVTLTEPLIVPKVTTNSATDPSAVYYTANGVSPATVAGSSGWGVNATLTTPSVALMPDAPCSGLVTWTNVAGIMTSTCTAAPTGAIVGTSDTQALTNKTLDGVTPTTMGYVDATSSIQTQFNGKQSLLFLNIKDYGATGNGTTDDTTAIQSALNAANATGGGEVFCPAGKYKITAPLLVYSNTAFIGVGSGTGSGTTIGCAIEKTTNTVGTYGNVAMGSATDNYNVDAILEIVHAPNLYAEHFQIKNMFLWGNSGTSNAYGIFNPRSDSSQFDNVTIWNQVVGFYTYNSWNDHLSSMTVQNTSHGFWWTDDGSGNSTGDNNKLELLYVDGIVPDAGRSGTMNAYSFYQMNYSQMSALAADSFNVAAADKHGTNTVYYFFGCEGVTLSGSGAETTTGGVYYISFSHMTINGINTFDTNQITTATGPVAILTITNSDVTLSGSSFAAVSGTGNYYNYLVQNGSTLHVTSTVFPTGGNTAVNTAGTYAIDAFIPNTTVTIAAATYAANSKSTVATVTMAGLTTSSGIHWTPSADYSGVTGWGTSGGLEVFAWPSAANTVSYYVINPTGGSITSSASTTWILDAK